MGGKSGLLRADETTKKRYVKFAVPVCICNITVALLVYFKF